MPNFVFLYFHSPSNKGKRAADVGLMHIPNNLNDFMSLELSYSCAGELLCYTPWEKTFYTISLSEKNHNEILKIHTISIMIYKSLS